jgi:hypothetical protein
MTEEQLKKLEQRDAIIHEGRVIFEDLTLGDLGNIQYALAFVLDKLENRDHSAQESFRATLRKVDGILMEF